MADTANYSWTKPTVGGDTDTWGTILNTLIDDVDTSLKTVEDAAPKKASNGSDFSNLVTFRTNVGLAIGTNVQAYDAGLQSIAGLTTSGNQLIYTTALDTYATSSLTAFARTILDDTDAATVRGTLGLGTASTQNTGTSGATLPFLNGANTWSGVQIFTAAPRLNYTTTLSNDDEPGFRIAPENQQNANYTLVMDDAGRAVTHTSASAHAWTIPPNSSVAFPVGTVILMDNSGSGDVTITRGSGVSLRLGGSSTDANLTLAQYGFCSLFKRGTNNWVAQGSGLS